MKQKHPILVWDFYDAPKNLQELSQNGGDEDWLAEIPPQFRERIPDWIDRLDTCFSPQKFEHPDIKGWLIYIGSHA